MQKLLFVFLLFALSYFSSAQVNTDSLIALLPKAKSDTNKVNIYKDITATLRFSDPQQAIALGQEGLQLAKELSFKRGITWLQFNISTAYYNVGKPDTSIIYLNLALQGYKELNELSRIGLSYLNRADVYRQLQNHAQTLKDCDSALYYADKANNNDIRARVNQTFGAVYFQQENYQQSITYFNKALQLYEEQKNMRMSANVMNNIGLVYKTRHEFPLAVQVTRRAIQIADSLKNEVDLSIFYGNLADVYFMMEDYDAAEKNADKAMYYGTSQNNDWLMAIAAVQKANAALKQKRFNEAIGLFNKAMPVFNEINDPERISTSTEMLAEAYAGIGDYVNAYHYIRISRTAADTMSKLRYAEDIAAMQAKFKVDEKDKEIQLLAKDKELQRQKLNQQRLLFAGAVILAALALLGAWLLLNRNRLKQKMKELELRNRIAADLHDEVGSSLSSIHMLSQMAAKGSNEEQRSTILQKMSENARETMDKMGDIVWMIKPGETEAGSLRQRIERFASEVCNSKGIELSLSLQELENAALNMEQRKNIYLVCKEAINNAAKYSGTASLEVATKLQENILNISIADKGKGFTAGTITKGNGIDNMEARAREINGILRIEAAEGRGTTISLDVPV
ncbi:MAG: sensor histidine kinase [Ferruginibacter sp.]